MSLDDDIWTIAAIDKTTGQNSTLRITKRRAGSADYNYAMLVNENIDVDTECDLMPHTSDGILFTNISLDGGASNWTTRANCKGDSACDCGNSASVTPAGDVKLGWHN